MGASVHCILVAVHLGVALVTAQSIGGCLECCVESICNNCLAYVRGEVEGTCYCPQSSTTVTSTPQSSNYYWFGGASTALTIGASATADLRSGTYSTVNAASSSVITVGSTTLLSTIVVGGSSVYTYNFGTVTGIALPSSTSSATVSIAASGTVGTITSTGGTVSLIGTGIVPNCVQSGGSITVANGVTVSTLRGSGTFSIASPTTAITVTGTSIIYGTPSLVTVNSAGVAVTVGSGTFAAVVATLDGGGSAPTVHVYRSVGSMFSNGVTTVFSGGSITSLTHGGGTVSVVSGATVATFAASGSTTVTVDGTIGTSSASSGSSLTFSGAGIVTTHQQAGGSVTVASGATVSTLGGSGTFSIASTMTAVTITGASMIYGTPHLVTFASAGVVLTVGSASSGATVATLEGGSAAPTVHVYRSVGVLLSNGVTTVHSGGSITTLTHTGGTVTVGSGATVATFAASGSMSVTVNGTIGTSSASAGSSLTFSGAGMVTTHSQDGGTLVVFGVAVEAVNTSGNATVVVRSNASVGHLLVGGPNTTITMEGGGLVSGITLLPSASVVFIKLSDRGSAFSALVAAQGSRLDTLAITVTNNATFGCLDLSAITMTRFTLRCSGLHLQQRACAFLALSSVAASVIAVEVVDSALDFTDHPVLLLGHHNALSLIATFTRCSLTTQNSDVLQLVSQAATMSLSVNVTDCVVEVQQSGGLLLINGTPNISGSAGEHTITRRIAVVNSNVTVDASGMVTCISGASSGTPSAMVDVVVMGGQWTWSNESLPAIAFDVGMNQTGDLVWGLASLSIMDVALIVASGEAVIQLWMPVVLFRGDATSSRFTLGTILLSNVSLTASTALSALPTVSFVHVSGAVVLDGATIVVAGCSTPSWYTGGVRAVSVQSTEDGSPSMTGTTITVRGGPGTIPTRNFTAIAVDVNISAPYNSAVRNCTIVVQCMNVPTTSVSLVDLGGVVVNSTVRVELVAIRQTENTDAAVLVNLRSTNASSSENHVHIIHSNVRVPILILSATGAAVFAAAGIVLQCSYVGSMPLSVGYLSAALASKVSPGLSACVTTKRSVVPNAVDAMQCWSTLTYTESGSATTTEAVTRSETTSTTRSLGAPTSTATLNVSSTCSLVPTPSLSLSLSMSVTTTLTPSPTTSPSHTWSPSLSGTHSGVSRTATSSWTATLSLSTTHSNMPTLSNSPTPSPSKMLSSSASRRSPTQSTVTLRPSSSGSLKFCECTGIPVEALNVFLAVPDNASSGNASSTQTTLAPGTVNGTSLRRYRG